MMESIISRFFIIFLLGTLANSYDDVEVQVSSGVMLKLLRDMANQSKADTLNLPANASSIRENITDTFSCENRTYGYYADVDNECQIFHVCYPTQLASGRSVVYKWSFICPNETVFNQEVLVCTRPIDAIPCEESPDYYHLNNEIGKVPNKTEEQTEKTVPKEQTYKAYGNERYSPRVDHRYQNLVVENAINDFVKREFDDRIDDLTDGQEIIVAVDEEKKEKEDEERIALERNVRQGRKRGSLKFNADV